MKYLVDTDYMIDFLKGKEAVVKKLTKLFDEGLATSVISVGEIYDGLYGSDKRKEQERIFLDFLGNVEILDIDPEVAKVFGKIRHNLRKEGKIIDNFDLLIAATCLSHGIALVTGNIGHFKRIKGLKIS